MDRNSRKQWARRFAWGGALVLGAAPGMGSALLQKLDRVRHELPVAQLAAPDRASSRPAPGPQAGAAPDEGGTQPGEPAIPGREGSVASLSLAATITDPDDTRAAIADQTGLWVATGGGLLRVPFEGPDDSRWWTAADGLLDHRLTAIAEIPGGLALGTEGGMVITVRVEDGVPAAVSGATLTQARISDLVLARGTLFAATWGEGVFAADVGAGDPEWQAVGPDSGLLTRQVTSLAWLDGELLAGTAGAGLWVRGEDGRSQRHVARGGLAGDFVLDLAVRGGRVWAATPTGLSSYAGGTLRTLQPGESSPAGSPRAVGRDGSIAVAGGRVGRIGSTAAEALPTCPDSASSGVPVPEIRWFADGGGRRWAGTDRGLLMEGDDGWRWITHPGPGSNDVTSVAARDGSLVVGTFDRGAWRDGRALSLASSEVNGTSLDAAGNAWIATSAGLARADVGGNVRTFGTMHGLLSEHVTAVASGLSGPVVGTAAGVQRWEAGAFASPVGGARAGDVSHVYALALAGERVVAGTLYGLWDLADDGATRYRYETGELPDNWVGAVALGPDGRLWVGTYDDGVAVRDRAGRWTWLRPGAEISDGWTNPGALAALPDGTVLVGTMGGGLLRIGPAGEIGRWRMADGLAGDNVTAVAVDGQTVWVGTRSGLSRMEVGDAKNS